jgi:hypothetical protein
MTTFDPTQLNALIADLEAKEQALLDASDANNAAQAAAQAAIANATGTAQAQSSAHDDLSVSISALTTYLGTLSA